MAVSDVGASTAFYREVGFCEVITLARDEIPYFVEMQHVSEPPGTVLMLLDHACWDFASTHRSDGVVLYLGVSDVDDWWSRLSSHPAVERPLQVRYYGREFVMCDPDGTRLAFFQPHADGERLPPRVSKSVQA